MTYEQLQKVNETLTATPIGRDGKAKDYVEVNQRVKAFRQLYPNGSITTSLESNENGVAIMRALIVDDNEKVLATGWAYEKEGNGFINKTSYIENCETSAVGRALGFLGIGIDTSIASAEEVQNAQLQQAQTETITDTDIKALRAAIEKAGLDEKKIFKKDISKLTFQEFKQAMDYCHKVEKEKK